MTDDEFDAIWSGDDPGPESNVRIFATLAGGLLLFWGLVVLLAVVVIA